MKLRNGCHQDFDDEPGIVVFFIAAVILYAAICCVFVLVYNGLGFLFYRHAVKQATQENLEIEEFNSWSIDKRQHVAEFAGYELDDDGYRMSKIINPPTNGDYIQKEWYGLTALIIIALATYLGSWTTFAFYHEKRWPHFFYADLPYQGWHKLIPILVLYAAWPILFVSFCRMQYHIHTKKEPIQTTPEIVESKVDEPSHSTAESQDGFRQFYQGWSNLYLKRLQKNASDLVQTRQYELRRAGETVRQCQKQLSAAKLKLQELEGRKPVIVSDEECLTMWQDVRRMRGVYDIYTDTSDSDELILKIAVHVKIPYNGYLYDGGEYLITIVDDDYSALRTSSKAFYSDDEYFCFGNRSHSISEYFRSSKFGEAITLIIDSLHTVNEGEQKHIPERLQCLGVDSLAEMGGEAT